MKSLNNHKDLDSDLRTARADIDAIDDEIHRLLISREAVVQKIMRAKGLKGLKGGGATGSANPIRFAREAQILCRLEQNHKRSASGLAFTAVARIWHELIAAYTLLQNDYAIIVTDEALMGTARSQFGDLVRMHKGDFNPNDENGKNLWVVPHPKIGDDWLKLVPKSDLKITAALPFVHEAGDSAAPKAYVIGTAPCDFSDETGKGDVLCLKLQYADKSDLPDLNNDSMIGALAQHDICAIAASGRYLYCERHAHLPTGGAVSHASWQKQLTVWESVLAEAGVEKIEWIGIYAKPLSVK